uniref:Uncharacterized protein n=1 Tax=Arundo donax TaxID=35708 RepID=A0A0A9EZT1_ARUDO
MIDVYRSDARMPSILIEEMTSPFRLCLFKFLGTFKQLVFRISKSQMLSKARS